MRTILRAAAVAATLASIVGCGKLEKLGGGSRSIVAGGAAKEAVYGIRDGKKLGFVVFTDIQADGTTASGGSTWTGEIVPAKGMSVKYEGSAEGININGTGYQFASGRVFLVSTKADKLSVTQPAVPVGEGDYGSEIDRLAKTKEVQEFLGK